MKKFIALFTLVLSALVGNSAYASIPTIDSANLAQAIQQVVAWQKQYQQMVDQFQQAKQQYNSLTGTRNLGDILNNPALQGVVPSDIATIYSAVQQGGQGGLTNAAQLLRNATQVYDCQDRTGLNKATCQALLNNNAQTQAYATGAVDIVTQRVAQIQSLQSQINATNDPKSIAELQARLIAENAQVSNDANRLAVLKMMADAQERAAEQALYERQLKNLSSTKDGTENFVFRPRP